MIEYYHWEQMRPREAEAAESSKRERLTSDEDTGIMVCPDLISHLSSEFLKESNLQKSQRKASAMLQRQRY